ncbi:cytochrome P450 [Endogone sp. FLAS-F59071]|nr:cytochrome P450 [Endogone sp. FLAS-F59071]|eukprot:RUS19007.1 cytochrome P450 [Endogone sp. FLAS-F59071]
MVGNQERNLEHRKNKACKELKRKMPNGINELYLKLAADFIGLEEGSFKNNHQHKKFTMFTYLLAFVVGFGLAYHYVMEWKRARRSSGRSLPGPWGLPFFGNILEFGLYPHLTFNKWKQKYGAIYQIHLGIKPWIVINDASMAHELMVKRGSSCSGRDSDIGTAAFIHPENRGIIISSGKYFGKVRRLTFIYSAQQGLGMKSLEIYTPFIEKESLELVRSLYNVTLDPAIRFRGFTLNIMLTVLYGKRYASPEDPTFVKLDNLIVECVDLVGFHIMLNIIPILRYLPLSFNKKVKATVDEYYDILRKLYKNYLEEEQTGVAQPCMANYVKNNLDKAELDELDLHHLFLDLITAGVETTATTLNWIVAILASQPEIQKRAHTELDSIIGCNRLPLLSDKPNLPYTHAILREATRFRPAGGWISIPHHTTCDNIFQGYHIPNNTGIVANVYAINLDPMRYVDPDRFDPDRFVGLKASSAALANGPIEARDHVTFGWGRRLCPGMHLADTDGFLALAKILWCYRIELDKGGKVPDINDWQHGFGLRPKPFSVKFVPRHELVKSTLFA